MRWGLLAFEGPFQSQGIFFLNAQKSRRRRSSRTQNTEVHDILLDSAAL